MTGWIGYFGAPPDMTSWVAVGLALVCAALAWRSPAWLARALATEHHCKWVAALATLAALLSLAYVVQYLRGGPRIIDATSYYLEARALAHGLLAFPLPDPAASFQGRFLVSPDDSTTGVLFPPGYPAVLALGFVVGAPLLVGPAIAAGIVVVTHALAKVLTGREGVALLAAALSTVSATLRYHTADTMSHGWSALLLALALFAAFRSERRWWVLGGLAAGWLVATRPVSGVVLCVLLGIALARKRTAWAWFGLAVLPGLVLLGLHQQAVTGEWWVSSQRLYYRLADGPPGCFAYGFGSHVGCRFEHGDFVQAVLPDGFGWREAARTTWARVHTHLRDAANLQLLAGVLLAGTLAIPRRPRLGIAALGVVAIVLAYLPFYFDGSYPGGGARFYADVLPLEHVLLAQGFFVIGAWRLALPLALIGFGTQTTFDHRALMVREGGRPMFEPGVVRGAGVERGLVLLATDHGFNLAFDPTRVDADRDVVFARLRGDANDRILWERLGRPPTYRYVYDFTAPVVHPHLEPYRVDTPEAWRFEAEHLWPAGSIAGGWVAPTFPPCASNRRGLALHGVDAELRFGGQLFVPSASRYRVLVGWFARHDGPVRTRISIGPLDVTEESERHWGDCWVQELGSGWLPEGSQPVSVQAVADQLVLDFIELHLDP